MNRNCEICGECFEITPKDLEFYKKVSPKIGGKVYEIPPPTICPEERIRRRMTWRNERTLYSRVCDLSKVPIISMYHKDLPFPVYGNEAWHGDGWNPFEYGRDFNFSKPFFENFAALSHVAPRINLMNQNSENSVFCNYAFANKNCYLVFGSHYNEDSQYSEYVWKTRNCLDCLEVLQSELVYEGISSENCYSCRNIEYCFQCSDCEFSLDLIGCKNCFLCSNLRNKEYSFRNEKFSREEYLQKREEYLRRSPQQLQKDFSEMKRNAVHRSVFQRNCENCTGSDLQNCRNIRNGFNTKYAEDISYASGQVSHVKDAMDVCFIGYDASELLYECIGNSGNTRARFCYACWHNSDILYCEQCFDSHDLFACIGLRHAQYSILNRQYSKEQYEELVPQIIEHMQKTGEWGEFFPIEMSPFAYNETVAQEYFPMTKEEVLSKGWKWRDEENKVSDFQKIIPAEKLPDKIQDIPDDILNWAIKCEESEKLFKIQKAELSFYRKMNLPIPHFHSDIKHQHRMKLRNPRKLFQRNCDKCHKQIQTTFAPERPETVYCEECYLELIHK